MFKFLNFRFVFFIDNLNIDSSSRADFIAKLPEELKENQVILPVPDEAPRDIPIMTTSSKNNICQIVFFGNKIDISFNFDEKGIDNQNEYVEIFRSYLKDIYSRIKNIKVKSVGFVISNIRKDENAPNKIEGLLDASKKNIFLFEPEADFRIKNSSKTLDKIGENTFSFNIISEVFSGRIKEVSGEKENKIFVFQLDMNTKADEKELNNLNEILDFVNLVIQKNNEKIDLINNNIYE